MTKDLRQAILALTDAVKTVEGHALEHLRENVLALMPPGPILETLWAGMPVPKAIMSGPEGGGYVVNAYYPEREMADRMHMVLAKPLDDHLEELRLGAIAADAASAKAKIDREHALEKRLLQERDAFAEEAHDTPFRQAIEKELQDMADQQIVSLDVRSALVAGALTRIKEASAEPLHPETEERADPVSDYQPEGGADG